jgi:uncharacterized membrane protein
MNMTRRRAGKARAVPRKDSEKRRENPASDPAKQNVRLIARLENAASHHRSTTAVISDVIAGFAGSGTFILIHVGWFGIWVLLNVGLIPGIRPFDPYPFTFLTMIVSLEAIFLSIFVLISQNHMAHLADRRAHLDLQINLLAEQENTLILRMLRQLCEKQGIKHDQTTDIGDALFLKTDLEALMKDLEEHLPEDQD